MQPEKNYAAPVYYRATCYVPCGHDKVMKAFSNANHVTRTDRRSSAIRGHWNRQDFLDQITDYAERHEKDLLRNQWEHESYKKAFYSRVHWEMEKIKNKMEEDLEQRRNKLSDLLKKEEANYLEEASISVFEDSKEKQQRMLDRYCELKTKKERKRQEIAREKKEQQFRQNCDELRNQMSKKMQQLVTEEGKKIVEERQQDSMKRRQEEEFYERLMRAECEEKRQKEDEEKEERKRLHNAYGKCVQDQIEAKNLEKIKKLREKEEEAEILAEQKRLDDLDEMCEKELKKRKKEEMKKNLDGCLKEKLKNKSRKVQDDLLQDLFFLKQIMDDEDETQRNAKKRALLKEQQEYLMYLREQMKKENDFEKEIDKLYQDEVDKIWEKRQAEWDEEKQKRRELETDVMDGIKEQIRANNEKSKQALYQNKSYAQTILKEDENDKKKNEEKLKLIRERNEKHQNELLIQIREKKERLKEEKRLLDMEAECIRRVRSEEDSKIQKLLSEMKIDHEHPYRSSNREQSKCCNCCNACTCHQEFYD